MAGSRQHSQTFSLSLAALPVMVHALGTAVNTHLKQSLGVWLLSYSPSICPVTLLKFSDLDSLSSWGNWGSASLSDCLGHTTIKWPSWHLNLGLPMFKAHTFDSALFCHSIVSHFTKHIPGPSFLLLVPLTPGFFLLLWGSTTWCPPPRCPPHLHA